jgi:hypothetical protein
MDGMRKMSNLFSLKVKIVFLKFYLKGFEVMKGMRNFQLALILTITNGQHIRTVRICLLTSVNFAPKSITPSKTIIHMPEKPTGSRSKRVGMTKFPLTNAFQMIP